MRAHVRRHAIVILSVLAAWLPSDASADWAYTRWGMTPEEVVSASGGSVTLLPEAQRTRNEDDHWELVADGTYTDGSLKLPVGFTFDTTKGGLTCVMYNAVGSSVEPLRQEMDKRYGKPARESSFGSTRTAVWNTPDKIERVIAQSPPAVVVSHCAP